MKRLTNFKRLEELLLLMIFLPLIILACNASKKTQAQKDAESRQKQIDLIKETRRQLPCDTVTTFVNVGVPIQGPRGILIKGDSVFVTDTIYQPRDITKVVIDSALAHQRLLEGFQKDYYIDTYKSTADSAVNEIDKLKSENAVLSSYKTKWNWLKGIGISFAIGALLWVFRKKIVSLFMMFIK